MNRMKCTRCRAYADFAHESHNAKYCAPCFKHHFLRQTQKAIDEHEMFSPKDRILVAVSGGKDSLGLWAALLHLKYEVDGIFIDLGFDEVSARAQKSCQVFADYHGQNLYVFSLVDEVGKTVVELKRGSGKPTCAVCGLIKRYIINGVAKAGAYDCVTTGHNLDDETAKLLSNVLRWREHHLAHQSPLLAERDGFVRKAKPFYRLDQEEIRYWNRLEEISFYAAKCPHSKGATLDYHNEALSLLEERMPGIKRNFLYGFFSGGQKVVQGEEKESLTCHSCGETSVSNLCVFCRLLAGKGKKPDFAKWWNKVSL